MEEKLCAHFAAVVGQWCTDCSSASVLLLSVAALALIKTTSYIPGLALTDLRLEGEVLSQENWKLGKGFKSTKRFSLHHHHHHIYFNVSVEHIKRFNQCAPATHYLFLWDFSCSDVHLLSAQIRFISQIMLPSSPGAHINKLGPGTADGFINGAEYF